MFLSLPDPEPLVRDTDPDPDPSIIKQKYDENKHIDFLLFCDFFMTFYLGVGQPFEPRT